LKKEKIDTVIEALVKILTR